MVALPVVITGSIDRIDRLPSGGIEVIDLSWYWAPTARFGMFEPRGVRGIHIGRAEEATT